MISSAIRLAAILASLVLLVSFGLFAFDQAGGASNQAQAEVGSAGAQVLGPPIRTAGSDKGGVRGAIDDVNRVLVSPVHALAPGGSSAWGTHIFDLLGGLLLYGLILGIVARSTGLAKHPHVPGTPQRPETQW
jgi:hypothetical protein